MQQVENIPHWSQHASDSKFRNVSTWWGASVSVEACQHGKFWFFQISLLPWNDDTSEKYYALFLVKSFMYYPEIPVKYSMMCRLQYINIFWISCSLISTKATNLLIKFDSYKFIFSILLPLNNHSKVST